MNQAVTENTTLSFATLGLPANILHAITKRGLVVPTPIQEQAIPVAMKGGDVIGIAQTGTGKTFAFGLPLMSRLPLARGRALILVPTRELAVQVESALSSVGHELGMKTAVLIGGEGMGKQIAQLRARATIIVATPGRLIDHLERRTVGLSDISVLVLDEADRMLDMGFAPQLKKILAVLPKERQTMLFSATMPPTIVELASAFLKTPMRVEVAPQGTTVKDVTQELFIVKREGKMELLTKLCTEEKGSVLVFSRTKHGATKICRQLNQSGLAAAEIHANRSLHQRLAALEGFKRGRYRILVATDIAARGIDVTGIALVINYDLPQQPEDYVHRIGRTARAGRSGKAISFATPDQRGHLRSIERLISKELPTTKLAEFDAFAAPASRGRSGSRSPRPQYGTRPRSAPSSGHVVSGRSYGSRPRGGGSSGHVVSRIPSRRPSHSPAYVPAPKPTGPSFATPSTLHPSITPRPYRRR